MAGKPTEACVCSTATLVYPRVSFLLWGLAADSTLFVTVSFAFAKEHLPTSSVAMASRSTVTISARRKRASGRTPFGVEEFDRQSRASFILRGQQQRRPNSRGALRRG